MPDFNELKQPETYLNETEIETEIDNDSPEFQLVSQGSADSSPPDEGGGLPAGSDNGSLFSFLDETHLQEAQEFRRKGHNRQVPEVDPGLVTQLHEALRKVRTQISHHVTVSGPLGSMWLQGQIGEIERLTDTLSDDVIKSWVAHEIPGKRSGEADGEEAELGSRRTAQSLVRRLESTLRTLIHVVDTLRAIDDHSTRDKREALLLSELVRSFPSSDQSAVLQAQERMTSWLPGYCAWNSLVQARAAAWETDKAAAISTMIETTRHEADKANKKAGVLQGESHNFFTGVARYLELLSSDLLKASINVSQGTSSPGMPDKAVAPLSGSDSLLQKVQAEVSKKELQAKIALTAGKVKLNQTTRVIRHGHFTETPSKKSERVVVDSVIRSILWQWQQPAIKIQYASGAILSKVVELKNIQSMFSPDAVTYDKGSHQEGQDISAGHPGEDDLEARVRQWVSDGIERETPESQLSAKVELLAQLLDGDIASARSLVERLGRTEESIQNMLRRQRFAVLKMATKHIQAASSVLKEVDTLLPEMAGKLTASIAALDNALQAAGHSTRDFSTAKKQASDAQLRATEVKESLSAASARLTERPLDELSRGSRLAKHWASLAKEQNPGHYPPPDAESVFCSLKKQSLLDGVLSTGDPEGYLFATRLAGEFENARNNELKLPMSPEQYTALEKGLVEYIVKWGQKRVTRGVARIIIELAFEQGLDAVSFSVSSLFRIPFKILKASIKIPYSVNKVNRYTMPGHDKPYKAIYGLLEKKLKQLGFNLVTAPVPGMIKLAAGAGITAGAALYNLHVGNKEKRFSAVYQRLAEGEKSERIKMQSAGTMIFDTVLDTTTAAAFKGTPMAWGSGKSKNNAIPDSAFVNGHADAVDENIYSQIPWEQMAAEKDSPVRGNVAENEKEAGPASDGMPLRQQTDVHENGQPGVRNRRAPPPAASSNAPAPSRKWHHNMPAGASLQSEHFDFDRGIRYQDLPVEKKQRSYAYAIGFVLRQIENDNRLPQAIRDKAGLTRLGARNLVPVDIQTCQLNNTILLPDSDGAKTGVLICLDSETPYYHIRQGSDLPAVLASAMPHHANQQLRLPAHVLERMPFEFLLEEDTYFPTSANEALNNIRRGEHGFFDGYFNFNAPAAMDIASLSRQLADTIAADYSLKGRTVTNSALMHRAVAGAHMPHEVVSVSEAYYHTRFVWGGSTAAEYLRAFERPFATLSRDMQAIISSAEGETVQEANQHIQQAEYIGSWIDATAGAVNSLTPEGLVFSGLQSVAGIAADVAEGKEPDPLAIVNLVIGCIPEGRIAAKVGKFSRIGGSAVKYGLMLGNKAVDLVMVGRSIKTAVETGDPLAIYQALLASGMSARNSYDMARDMSSRLNISRRMEDIASPEQFEAIHSTPPEPTMTERTFRLGSTELRGRIKNGEIEISSDGVTWERGNTLHLLAYRLQNAGGRPRASAGGESSRSEVFRENTQLATWENLSPLMGKGPFTLEGSPDDVPFDYQVYRYDDIGAGVHMREPENIETGGAQCEDFLLRGTGEDFLSATGEKVLDDNVRVLNVVNGDAGTVAVKIPLNRITTENPLLAWSGDLSGCTVVYAVKGNDFYIYHAGLRSNAEGLPAGWSTGVEGVNSIAKSHTALTGEDASAFPHENNSLVDIFSSYDSAVIVYMGKTGRVITKTSPNIHTFNYAEIPTQPFTSRVASSQVLLTRVGGKIKVVCISEDIFNPTVPGKSMAEVKKDFRVLKSSMVVMGAFDALPISPLAVTEPQAEGELTSREPAAKPQAEGELTSREPAAKPQAEGELTSREPAAEHQAGVMPSRRQYEPHTPGYQKDYSIDLEGFGQLRAKLRRKFSRENTRVQRFNKNTNSYDNVNDYEVVPYQTTILDDGTLLNDTVVRQALRIMERKYEFLNRIATDYTGSNAANLKANLKIGGELISGLCSGLPDQPSASVLHFLLIEKTAGPVTAANILGVGKIVDLLPGNQPGEKGSIILESVVAHPYTLISKNEDFIRYAARRGLQLSEKERTRYKIKRIGSQLMRDGLKKTMQKIDQEMSQGRSSRPQKIQFSARNPITARMAERFGARRVDDSNTPPVANLQAPPLSHEQLLELERERKRYRDSIDRIQEGNSADEFARGQANRACLDTVRDINDEMSELELTRFYNNPTVSLSIEQRGALSNLIETVRQQRLIQSSLTVANKYSSILGQNCTQSIMSPQTFLLSAAGTSENGRCFPMVLSAAVALKANRIESLIGNFYRAAARTEAVNRNTIQALDLMYNNSAVLAHLSYDSFNGGNAGTVEQIIAHLKGVNGSGLFTLESSTHAMMVGVTTNGTGAKSFHFYDPNVGFFSYASAQNLESALQKTVGTKAVGDMYKAFGTPPKYKLGLIDTEGLGNERLLRRGHPESEAITVLELSQPQE